MNYQLKTILMILISIMGTHASQWVPSGNVEFTAKGFPTFITINGKGEGVKGQMEAEGNQVKSGTFIFPLGTLKTGMDLRDEHMHDKYLETKKYPEAKLTIPSFTLNTEGTVEGTLFLHNKEKKVSVSYQREGENPMKIKAEFKLTLEDFQIDIPSFQGITVAKDILIKVDLVTTKR